MKDPTDKVTKELFDDPYAHLKQAYKEGKKLALRYGVPGYYKWYPFQHEPLYMLPVDHYKIIGEENEKS